MMTPVLLSAALLLLLPATTNTQTPISILVMDSVTNAPNKTYTTSLSFRGILLGGMRKLRDSDQNFTFSYTEDPNYGPFLRSVNGVYGCEKDRTYWELLVKTADDKIVRPDVGVGCYIPSENQTIIFNFNTY